MRTQKPIESAIQAAVLEHQKNCLTEIRETMSKIWKSIRKVIDHQERLTNSESTGKVDVLWLERNDRMQEEKERRKYWTRWLIITAVGFVLSNLALFGWFLNQIKAIIAHNT